MLRSGTGGVVTITEIAKFDGGLIDPFPGYPVWAAQETYEIDQVVKESNASDKYFAARATHVSKAGDQAANAFPEKSALWQEVQKGEVILLVNWEVGESAQTEKYKIMKEKNARPVSTTIEGTGALKIAAQDGDKIQKMIKTGYHGNITIYPSGVGSGKPRHRFAAAITSVRKSGNENVREIDVNFEVDGDIDDSDQA